VRITPDCDHGATVTITPTASVQVKGIVYAKDHRITALALTVKQPAVILAWRDQTFVGQLQVG